MAGMAPDLISFLATSLASLASAGLLGNAGFSGSGFGAFNACKAFFLKIICRSRTIYLLK